MAKALKLTALEAVDPRVRMKEVRAEIKMFVEGGTNPWGINHVGELYDNPEDMARAMIALHDLLDARTQKHNKASVHVAELLDDNDRLNDILFNCQNENSVLKQALSDAVFLDKINVEEIRSLKAKVASQDAQLQSVMATLKIAMGA